MNRSAVLRVRRAEKDGFKKYQDSVLLMEEEDTRRPSGSCRSRAQKGNGMTEHLIKRTPAKKIKTEKERNKKQIMNSTHVLL